MNLNSSKRVSYSTMFLGLAAVFLVIAKPCNAAAEKERLFELRLFNSPVGKMKVREYEIVENGVAVPAISANTEITLNRMGEGVGVGMDHLEVFDLEGNLTRFRSETRSSLMPQITEGRIENGQCVIKSGGRTQTIRWDPETISEKQLEKDFKELIKKPVGSEMSHKLFVPDFLKSVPTTTTLLGREPRATNFGNKDLFKIRTTMDIGSPIVTHSWVDAEGELFEQEVALGPLTLQAIRISSAAGSQTDSANALPPDIFEKMILRTDKKIRNPQVVRDAIYKLTFKNGNAKIYEDAQQKILDVSNGSLRLQVTSTKPLEEEFLRETAGSKAVGIPLELFSPSPLVQSDAPEIVEIARNINDSIPSDGHQFEHRWQVAKKMESWVGTHLTEKNLSVAFASAAETLKTREGDCTEHATLLIALLRAAQIPARAAEGIVYAPSINGFGYHMWTEAFIGGQWHDLDATRPGEFTDATHIQMGASSLQQGAAGEMAQHILQYLGQFEIEIESTRN